MCESDRTEGRDEELRCKWEDLREFVQDLLSFEISVETIAEASDVSVDTLQELLAEPELTPEEQEGRIKEPEG